MVRRSQPNFFPPLKTKDPSNPEGYLSRSQALVFAAQTPSDERSATSGISLPARRSLCLFLSRAGLLGAPEPPPAGQSPHTSGLSASGVPCTPHSTHHGPCRLPGCPAACQSLVRVTAESLILRPGPTHARA